ncbi:MAG: polymer-forming cytoskeletal protein [Anaerolineales bacterium]|nr:polymer-forming cytoskeletal protein [Anaerolineales bacterium]
MFKRNPSSEENSQPAPAAERITSVLGAGIVWQGSMNGSGGVRIEGAFEGAIALRGMLVVGETGRVTCENVRAHTVIVAGAVRGNITAQKLEIRATGRVWGDVTTTAFVTEEGSFLRGQIRMEETVDLDLEASPETTPSEAAQAEAIAQAAPTAQPAPEAPTPPAPIPPAQSAATPTDTQRPPRKKKSDEA